MVKLLIHLKKGLVKALEIAVIVLVAVLVLDVLWGVFSRYVLGAQSRWTEELATMLLIWVSLLGAAVAFAAKAHLGVDYFVSKFDPSAQKLIEGFVQLIVFAFSAFALIHGGSILVSETLAAGQLSPALGLKVGYMYMAVPISGIFICLFSIEQFMELFLPKQVKTGEV